VEEGEEELHTAVVGDEEEGLHTAVIGDAEGELYTAMVGEREGLQTVVEGALQSVLEKGLVVRQNTARHQGIVATAAQEELVLLCPVHVLLIVRHSLLPVHQGILPVPQRFFLVH
jgi:hypothetical protein